MNPSIAKLCARYLADYPRTPDSKRVILTQIQKDPIGKVIAPGTARDYIDFARERRQTVAPATMLNYYAYLRGVLAYAKPGWDMADITDAPLREAMPILLKQGLVGTSKRRTRIPTEDEARALIAYLRARDPLKADILEFQDYSGRRISETCRIMWVDLNEKKKTILVRDMKHPRHKIGNNKNVAIPNEAFEIILRQRRLNNDPKERIFKASAKAVKDAVRRACDALGYDDLHLHDFRRGTVTRLLRQGKTVQQVMLVTGQETVDMVLTDYNGMRAEDFHA